jgi:hypothetical protein
MISSDMGAESTNGSKYKRDPCLQGKCGGCAPKAYVLIRGDLFPMRQVAHEYNPERVHPVDQEPGMSVRCWRI